MRKPTAQEVRKQQWKQLIIACNNSGMSKKKWCAENGINEKSFYYYQKILRNELLEEYTEEPLRPSFVDVTSNLQPIPNVAANSGVHQSDMHPDLVIRKGDLVFEISNTISPDLLRMLGGIINA